jgi:rhodanese-related sulfurtransferase
MRATKEYQAGHIRGAVSCGSCHAGKTDGQAAMQGAGFVDLSKKLVLYTETGKETIALPKMIAQNKRLYVLDGGYAGWKEHVLAPVVYGGETDEAEIAAKRQRDSVRGFFTGERPTSKVADLPVTPIRRENAHRPATTSEGC